MLGIIYSKDKYPSKFSFWSHILQIWPDFYWLTRHWRRLLKMCWWDVWSLCTITMWIWLVIFKIWGGNVQWLTVISNTDYFCSLFCWCWCYWCFFLVDVTDSTFQGKILHEPQPYVPSNPIHESDIEKLLSIESESMESSWSRVKKTKEAEVWRRESNEDGHPPITKVTLSLAPHYDWIITQLSLKWFRSTNYSTWL